MYSRLTFYMTRHYMTARYLLIKDVLLHKNILPFLVLSILGWYTWQNLVVVPYAGFSISPTWLVQDLMDVEQDEDAPQLEEGDRIVSIGGVSWMAFTNDLRQQFFEDVEPEESVIIVVVSKKPIEWTYSGWTFDVFVGRLVSSWFLAYIFFWIGTRIWQGARDRNKQLVLISTSLYVLSLFIVAGVSSPSHVAGSAIVWRVMVWLFIPLSIHFHFLFLPTVRIPQRGLAGLYGVGFLLAGLQIFQFIPANWAGLVGFGGISLGWLGFLVWQWRTRPGKNLHLSLLLKAWFILSIPLILFVILSALVGIELEKGGILLFILPIPLIYAFVLYRHQADQLTLWLNKAITGSLFITILTSFLTAFLTLVGNTASQNINFAFFSTLIATTLATIATRRFYGKFRRRIEKMLFEIPLATYQLLQLYTTRVATSLDREQLTHLLHNEVLSQLAVTQSVLFYVDNDQTLQVFSRMGLAEPAMLSQTDLQTLLTYDAPSHQIELFSWVRKAFPLKVGEEVVGLWLLGERPPANLYLESEMLVFEALASQTAVALANIRQSENLHDLYQASVNRYDEERAALARELHDDVLNRLAVLYVNSEASNSLADQAYQELTQHIRYTIHGLRPSLLDWGLYPALEQLLEESGARAGAGQTFEFDVVSDGARYAPDVEQYLFRIVQEAVGNACKHAGAGLIRVQGRVVTEGVELVVTDDGAGFPAGQTDLATLIQNKHYGLANLHERANLIGATLVIDSAPGRGTQISLNWTNSSKIVTIQVSSRKLV